MQEQTTKWRHRIGVKAEICFWVESDVEDPPAELQRKLAIEALEKAGREGDDFNLENLDEGAVYPSWQDITEDKGDPRLTDDITLYDSVIVEGLSEHSGRM
jgi:hypothetical protein